MNIFSLDDQNIIDRKQTIQLFNNMITWTSSDTCSHRFLEDLIIIFYNYFVIETNFNPHKGTRSCFFAINDCQSLPQVFNVYRLLIENKYKIFFRKRRIHTYDYNRQLLVMRKSFMLVFDEAINDN